MKFLTVKDPFASQRAMHAVGMASTETLAYQAGKDDTPKKPKRHTDRVSSEVRTRSPRKLAGSRRAKRTGIEYRVFQPCRADSVESRYTLRQPMNNHLRYQDITGVFPVISALHPQFSAQ